MKISKSFLIRAVSALVAVAVLIGLYVGFEIQGLKFIIVAAVLVGTMELVQLIFKDLASTALKRVFSLLSLFVFAATASSLSAGSLAFALALVLFIILSLLLLNRSAELEVIQRSQLSAALGFFYMGLLPAFVYRLLDQPQGLSWFVFLLTVVFSGDTMAYIFGVLMGKHKVMPSVSPKKTWQGSFGGILGSLIAGGICWSFGLREYSLISILILSALTGFVAQFGDFFESLLKRIAQVKDSGKIMPGHGGVLDRIDGVLFAAPVVLAGVLILSHLLS